jgi:hypothetical protein
MQRDDEDDSAGQAVEVEQGQQVEVGAVGDRD